MNEKNNRIIFLLLITILSILGGVVGSLVISRLFFYDYNRFEQIDFSGNHPGNNFVIRDAKNVVVQQDDNVAEIIGSSLNNYAAIYKKIDDTKATTSKNYYDMSRPVGQGIVLTSDGWIVSSYNVAKMSDYVVATKNKKFYTIDKVLTDKSTGMFFIHIVANGLTVQKLFDWSSDINGQTVVGVNWQGDSWLTSVVNSGSESSWPVSSDKIPGSIKLFSSPSKEFFGGAIFNLSGDCMGFIDNTGRVLSVDRFSGALRSLLKNGVLQYASLGVNFIDLAKIQYSGLADQSYGALLYGDESKPAVIKAGAADHYGLKSGDIIISIDGTKIDSSRRLINIILSSLPGETLNIEYLRSGEKNDVDVVLSEAK